MGRRPERRRAGARSYQCAAHRLRHNPSLTSLVDTGSLIPLDSLRELLETAASRALQREVQIRGHLRRAVLQELGLSLQDVSIANAKGAKDPEMIRVDKVVVGADLPSLLAGHLWITKVTLKGPTIHLEAAGHGVANWQVFENGAGAAESASAPVNLSIEKRALRTARSAFSMRAPAQKRR